MDPSFDLKHKFILHTAKTEEFIKSPITKHKDVTESQPGVKEKNTSKIVRMKNIN